MDLNQLEKSVTEILTDINVNVTSNDIKASHRIGKDTRIGSTKTIICTGNILSKLYIIKRNFPKSRKNMHLTLKIIPFLLMRI